MVLMPLFALCLRLIGYKRSSKLLLTFSPDPSVKPYPAEHTLAVAYMVAGVVQRAGILGIRPATCLERSLMLWWVLRWMHISSHIRVGVRRDNGQMLAHAWVEHQGIVVNDQYNIDQLYMPFPDELSPEKAGRFV